MDFETARNRLFNHANMTYGLTDASDKESLLFLLFNSGRSKVAPTELLAMRPDIIECLEVVNKNWNGPAPSNSTNGEMGIERYLVAALSQIIHNCWVFFREWQESETFEVEILNQLSFTAWSISFAWNAVLAGDVDSIAEELKLESVAREVF